jgi:Ca2+-binding RTX toxin-like protein
VHIGGPGDDTISPGTGRDLIRAGAGNDVINARDGSRDVIECASGVDRVAADRRDRLRGCEQVTKR